MDRESRDMARSEARSPRKPKKVGTFDGTEAVFTPSASYYQRQEQQQQQSSPQPEPENGENEAPPSIFSSTGTYKHPTELPHPVYSAISFFNGQVNRMNLNQLKMRCKELDLCCSGSRETVKRRLKEHYKDSKLVAEGLVKPRARNNVDYFVVIDFEATCEEKNPPDYKHEIIEFPAVLVSSEPGNVRIVDIFHEYVRPVINTELSEFCKNLTGIKQSTVDAARPFPSVHASFLSWMHEKHQLGTNNTFSIVTDGPFDMGRFLCLQCQHLNLQYPDYSRVWVNIRKSFMHFYRNDNNNNNSGRSGNGGSPMKLPGLQTMLDQLGLDFEGQPHSGLDDSKNIARVLVRLVKDHAVVRVNEKLAVKIGPDGVERDAVNTPKLRHVTSVPRREAEEWFEEAKRKVRKATEVKEVKEVASAGEGSAAFKAFVEEGKKQQRSENK